MDVDVVHIFLFFALSMGFAGVFVLLPIIVARVTRTHNPYAAKKAPYECGFSPAEGSRPESFNVQFYLMAMLFVVFDLEIALLLPWALQTKSLSIQAFCSGMLFLVILTLGLIYEMRSGVLRHVLSS